MIYVQSYENIPTKYVNLVQECFEFRGERLTMND